MSMPNIPDIDPTINLEREDVINLLLASVALEELGLAHIINAEAEKIQAALGTLPNTNLEEATLSELMEVNESVNKTLKTVVKKEMLLQFKLEDILELPIEPTPPDIEVFQNTVTVTGFVNDVQVEDTDEAFYHVVVN
ncbi:hypothetical protein [Texcoconibacillus texcoconensis]|uniref:Uncharacterized protein n=1 Tax=Texcoconibacillus texcoconensis TaxID=1095777 RepID=A0A840QQI1_9BACI|nr:hypothetical protein [Texcoconibacillus texcoconensis]MBB5173625.1 hypothetical protein [Texcoconibacillus texcoconensis]